MRIAVVKTGGKQYKVKKGDKIKVEKLAGKDGKIINFDTLLIADNDKVEIGTPKTKTKVGAKILRQGRSKKMRVVKYKSKTRYHKVYGHRQYFTELEIIKV